MVKGILLLLLMAGVAYFVLPALAKVLLRRRFLARVRRSGRVCLTFDDGPDPVATPAIARELARAGVRATFFMTGEAASRHPAVAALVAELGHEIGEHSFAHRHAWKTGPVATWRDLWRGHAALAAHRGRARSAGLRPPFGKLNLATLLYVWLRRQTLAFWDVDPRDYEKLRAEDVAGYVLDRLEHGRVILLHDGRAAGGSNPAVTLDAVRIILDRTAAGGVRFATVSEALALGARGNGTGRWNREQPSPITN